MNIRLAKLSDYAQVMALYNLFVGDNRYQKPGDDSFKEVISSNTGFIHVAEAEGRIVGYASFSIRSVVRYPQPIAELDELFVHEDFRRHGTGKLLMEAVITYARKQGAIGCI